MSGDISAWLQMTHGQIYESVQRGPGSGASMVAADMWQQAKDIIVAAEARTHAAITGSGTEWEGAAGTRPAAGSVRSTVGARGDRRRPQHPSMP